MTYRILLILLMIWTGGTSLQAQSKYTIKSKKAIRYYENAADLYQKGQSEEALHQLDQALKAEENFVEGWLFRADVLHELKREEEEIQSYRRAISIDADFFPNVFFNLGNVYFGRGDYDEALKAYNEFLEIPRISGRNRKLAEKRSEDCHFAKEAMEHPVDYRPENLGDSINTAYDEYWPSLTADEQLLVFTSLVPIDPQKGMVAGNIQEDFYAAESDGKTWKKAFALGAPLNSEDNEGAQSITADGRYMYFTACGRPGGMGRCDIYYSVREGDQWSEPRNLGKPVNSPDWDAQPSISADGRVLYFVSNRKGGKGKMDIWRSNLQEVLPDGRQRWSKPENLSINTEGNEMSPFIHAGNGYLYFSSDGLTGMGGYDLYRAERTGRNSWGEPENLGYPINTYGDEMGLVITARGDRAYFASNREEGKGRDLYRFELPLELQPMPVSYLEGRVFDAEKGKPLQAMVELVDLESRDTVAELPSDRMNGKYLVCLPSGREYAFNASAPGYLFQSEHFSLKGNADALHPQHLDIALKPIRSGETVVLKNVFFDTDSWNLKAESLVELDKLHDFLEQQKGIRIEIGGHTDSTGSADHNLTLSENRARAVYEYLSGKGISADRLGYKGYGASQPIATNETEEGKAQNRRTEFKILEK